MHSKSGFRIMLPNEKVDNVAQWAKPAKTDKIIGKASGVTSCWVAAL
jgi:hypothetical protein